MAPWRWTRIVFSDHEMIRSAAAERSISGDGFDDFADRAIRTADDDSLENRCRDYMYSKQATEAQFDLNRGRQPIFEPRSGSVRYV